MVTPSDVSAYLAYIQARVWGINKYNSLQEEKKSFLKAISLLIEKTKDSKFTQGVVERFKKDIESLDMRPVMALHSHHNGDDETIKKLNPEEIGPEFRKLLSWHPPNVLLTRSIKPTEIDTCLTPLFAFPELWEHLAINHPETLRRISRGLKKEKLTMAFLGIGKEEGLLPSFKEYKKPWKNIHENDKDLFRDAFKKLENFKTRIEYKER